MLWLYLTILSYFLFANVTIVDKYLLKARIPDPETYAFYVGILSMVYFSLIPFGFFIPNLYLIFLSISTGAIYIIYLFCFYKALKIQETSIVAPIVGALSPIFTFLLFVLFSKKFYITYQQAFAFLLLILGTVLISYSKLLEKIYSFKSLFLPILSSFFLGLFFTLAKFVYSSLPFINGLIWIKVGCFLTGLLFLISHKTRKYITKISLPSPYFKKTGIIFIGKEITGGLGSILQHLAVFLAKVGEVAFISALQGMQYIFILILSIILSVKFPYILKEELSKKVILKKTIAILLIALGLWVLAIS